MGTVLGAMILLAAISDDTPGDTPRGDARPPQLRPQGLRCEYRTDPLAVDVVRPRLSWTLAAIDPKARGLAQSAYHVLVATSPAALDRDAGDLWDSGRVASDATIHVDYGGKPLRSGQMAWWKVRVWDQDGTASEWSTPARWSVGLLEAADGSAKWIGHPSADGNHAAEPLPPPRLRKSFQVADAGTIRRATVYATALGLYELRLNGARAGDHQLAPEWTDYTRRVQVQAYDVTEQLAAGENVLAVQLADGWYAGRIGLAGIISNGPQRGIYGPQPHFLLQLEIETASGEPRRIVSDESWQSTREGPLRAADLLDGEVQDARRATPGWDRPGYDAEGWARAAVFEHPQVKRVAQPNEPIRICRERKPVAVKEQAPGIWVFDLGQNMVGWCRLRARGAAGQTITLRHAEVLNPDGSIYTTNLRGAAQTDRFILAGTGTEVFEPQFTYHGFRYVEVTGLTEAPELGDLTGCVVHSAAPEVGSFECSEPLLNRLWQNILWTQRDNLHSVPTDCPQRDERMGWMGDILAFAQTACFNMDMAAFYTKWLRDVRDAQTPDGRFPDFAPHPFDPNARFSAAPAWGDAGVFVPWVAYRNYGDVRLLEENYDAARRWVDWIHAQNAELLWKNGRGNDYGDWLNADTLKLEGWPQKGAEMPKEAFATAFFARSTQLVAEMARVLGRADDARRYAELAERIRAAFNRAYVSEDGSIQGDTQAGYAIALHFDLLPEAQRAAAARRMVACFDRYDGQIATGFHSTICLMNELTRNGYNDAAYRLILNRKMPSWGYVIDQGGTTIWERWDGYVEGRGFQDPGMNSFAHYALGSVGEWMIRTIVGINPDPEVPAYQQFILRPQPGGGLTWARGAYDSIRGEIASAWRIDADSIELAVTIPPNTSATVFVPTSDPGSIVEGGRPAAEAVGVKPIESRAGTSAFHVQSGSYTFRAKAPRGRD